MAADVPGGTAQARSPTPSGSTDSTTPAQSATPADSGRPDVASPVDGSPPHAQGPWSPATRTVRQSRRRQTIDTLVRLTKAVADVDPASIATSAERFGQSRSYLAPVAWAAGTLVLTLRGVKLLIFNWRLLFIQLVPAAWIWIVMYDLKQHTLRGVPFADLDLRARLVIWAVAIAWSIAAFWCNTVFAYAIDGRPPPRIRPAIHRTRRHWPAILASGTVLGGMLGLAAVTIPRLDRFWLFVVCLSAVLGIMMISFVAVPARLIGRRTRKLPPREAIGRTVTGWGISAIGMTPGVLLDRLGLLMIGVPGLRVAGFLVLSLGTALYAAGMSSVKAVKLSIKLGTDDLSDTGGGPEQELSQGAPGGQRDPAAPTS